MRPGLLVKIWRGMRGLEVKKTWNFSQNYVSTACLLYSLLRAAKNSLKFILAVAPASFCIGRAACSPLSGTTNRTADFLSKTLYFMDELYQNFIKLE